MSYAFNAGTSAQKTCSNDPPLLRTKCEGHLTAGRVARRFNAGSVHAASHPGSSETCRRFKPAAQSGCPAPVPRRRTGGSMSAGTGRDASMALACFGLPHGLCKPRRAAGRRRPGAPCPIWVPSPGATVGPAPTPSARPTAAAARSSISIKRMAESVLLDLCTPSPRGFARERRRRQRGGMADRNGVVLFFFYDKT